MNRRIAALTIAAAAAVRTDGVHRIPDGITVRQPHGRGVGQHRMPRVRA